MADRLSRRMREENPSSAHRTDPLSERALGELSYYEQAESVRASRDVRARAFRAPRVRRLRSITGLVTASLMIVVALVLTFVRPDAAVASTPPLLSLTPLQTAASELLETLRMSTLNGPNTSSTIRAQTWALSTSLAEAGSIEYSEIEPQWSETTFAADGSVHFTLVAAEPFEGQEGKNLPLPGTVLAEETYTSEEWAFPAESGPPADSTEVADYLANFSGNPSLTAGDALREIAGILSNYVLSRAQEAALLGYLQTLPGLALAGETTDRLGRAGIAFRATDREPGEFEDLLIISPESGRIIAAETIYVGPDRAETASPAVISYTAWER